MKANEIKLIRQMLDLTQQGMADKLKITRRTIQNYESGNRSIPLHIELLAKDIANKSEIPQLQQKVFETTENTNGNVFTEAEDGTFTVKVELIPFEAYGSYLESISDVTIQHDFDHVTFNVDHFGKGNYKAFRLKGDSMNGGGINDTPDGALILGRELQKHHWKDGFNSNKYGFVILAKSNIFHKDIVALDQNTGEITCHSRNKSPEYSDFTVSLNKVYQIFKVIKRTF